MSYLFVKAHSTSSFCKYVLKISEELYFYNFFMLLSVYVLFHMMYRQIHMKIYISTQILIHYQLSVMDYSCLSCKPNFAEVAHTKVEDISGRPLNFRQTTRLHFQQNYRCLFLILALLLYLYLGRSIFFEVFELIYLKKFLIQILCTMVGLLYFEFVFSVI